MKLFSIAGALALFVAAAFTAQARTITLDGEVHDNSNNLVTGTHDVTVAIYASSGGVGAGPVWSEVHYSVPFTSGTFSIVVGSLTTGGIPNSYFNGDYWYSVSVSGIGRPGELGTRTQAIDETTWTGFWKRELGAETAEAGAAISAVAFPNPFTSSMNIDLTANGNVDLVVYDILGREVAHPVQGLRIDGASRVEWKPEGLQPGAYIVRARVDGRESVSIPVRYMK